MKLGFRLIPFLMYIKHFAERERWNLSKLWQGGGRSMLFVHGPWRRMTIMLSSLLAQLKTVRVDASERAQLRQIIV